MKILLVNPAQRNNNMAKTARTFLVPQTTLAMIAALTPNDEVQVVDELVEDIDYDTPADIVGITAMTDNIIAAYPVADEFRKRGRPVVMGGAHPTACPGEALVHCDAVVAGEAEGTWEKVVDIVRHGGRPSGIYRGVQANMEGMAWPRRDLLKRDRYSQVDMVQTARGCPYACEFCSVHTFYGRKFRHRPVRDVVREVDETCGKRIFFVDDIINGDVKYAKQLYTELIPLKIQWAGQVTMNLGKDRELVKAFAKSGCQGVFIGIESVDQETLKHMKKSHNKSEKYFEQIRVIQGEGIPILGAFVFGFDTDDTDVFERTLEFALLSKIDVAQFNIITPLPGTDLYPRWEKEGRLRYKDWWLSRHWSDVLFNPVLMTPEQLRQGWVQTTVKYYKAASVAQRAWHSLRYKDAGKSLFISQMNWSYRQGAWNMARDMGLLN